MKCKCGRDLVKSPTNPKVRICDGCLNQKANCQCPKLEPLTPEESWRLARENYRRMFGDE